MNESAVRELKELAEKATPGPWVTDDPPGAASVWRGKWFGLVCDCQSNSREQDHVADAQYIAAASPAVVVPLAEDWLRLRDVVEAAKAMRERISKEDGREWDFGRWNECAAFDDAVAALVGVGDTPVVAPSPTVP